MQNIKKIIKIENQQTEVSLGDPVEGGQRKVCAIEEMSAHGIFKVFSAAPGEPEYKTPRSRLECKINLTTKAHYVIYE